MKIEDFEIGTFFQTCTGQVWRCTDVGTRTILAIELNPKLDAAWFKGPPYVVPEVPFDENDLARVYRNEEEAISQAIDEYRKGAHPGFPSEMLRKMGTGLLSEISRSYPRPKLLRIDRVATDGEILHPFAIELENEEYQVSVYRLFDEAFESLPEKEFIQLKAATESDIRTRKELFKKHVEKKG